MNDLAEIPAAPKPAPAIEAAAQLAEVLIGTINGALDRGAAKSIEALSALAYVSAELISQPAGKPWRDLRRSQRQFFDDSLGWYLAEIARQRAIAAPAP